MLSTEEQRKMNMELIANQQHTSTNAYQPENHALISSHDRLIIERGSQSKTIFLERFL